MSASCHNIAASFLADAFALGIHAKIRSSAATIASSCASQELCAPLVPQDTGQTLKDHVVHEQLLRSLRLVAKHSAAPLLDTLLYWRSEALKGFRGKTLTSSHKKLVIETAFLEAVLEIMEGAPAGADVHSRQANSLLK